jgi:outer membrane receptor protein involved in Fe transport
MATPRTTSRSANTKKRPKGLTATRRSRCTTTYYPKCEVKEWVTFGLGYTYTGFKNWTMSLNIQNLLDEKAPYDPGYTASGFNETLHNPYGRYFNVSARYTFK